MPKTIDKLMERLKLLMEKYNIKSQYALAKEIDIDYKVVNHWFTGRAKPNGDNLLKIASFFHVQPAWLRYGDPQSTPTLSSEAQILAAEIEKHGIEGVKKARQFLEIFLGENIKKETWAFSEISSINNGAPVGR